MNDKDDYLPLDLTIYLKVLKNNYKIICFVAAISLIISSIYAYNLSNMYKSEATLIVNKSDSYLSETSGLGPSYGGLATIAGLGSMTQEDSKVSLAKNYLNSRKFIYEFIESEKLKPILLATIGWSLDAGLIFDQSKYSQEINKWLEVDEPSLNDAYQHFIDNNFEFIEDASSGTYKLIVKHYSPELAKEMVDLLIQRINKKVKQIEIDNAKKNIRYLENELVKAEVSDMRKLFYRLIEKQQQKLMLAKVQEDFVFQTIDPAITPEKKYAPSRLLIVILITFLSTAFAATLTVFRKS